MLKRELKVNLKSFIIWIVILISLFTISFLVYPSIVESGKELNEVMKTMPKEMLKMFNMDIASIDNVFGWIKTEGYTFLLLIVGLYSSIMGSNILLKEESDKTIEYLYSKPITRNSIIMNKMITGIIYITLMLIIMLVFNLVGLLLSCDFSIKQYLLMSIMPLFSSFVLFFISMFISTFFNKTKKSIGISIGIVFISYFLMIFSSMDKSIEFLKYLSIYTLSDIRDIITNTNINFMCILICIIISVLSMVLTFIRYNKKELV